MNYANDHIRNVLIAGHGGAGKTSLAEALLFTAKSTDRLGRVEDGNTVCDDFLDPRRVRQALFDLGGGDVLALPAEGVADPVDEVEIAVGILTHQVAGAEPTVAALEDVGENFLL